MGQEIYLPSRRDYLLKKGHEVIFDLSENILMWLLLTEFLSNRKNSSTFNQSNLVKKINNPKTTKN